MTTFLSHEQPTVDAIRAHKYKNNAGGNTAVVEFDREHHSVTNFYIDDPDPARQLLAAAFEAVRILDPDGAADAVFALIEGDALAKILARAREEEAQPKRPETSKLAPDTFTCCSTPMPWPSRTEDVVCLDCGTVWEHDGMDLGAGARIKAMDHCSGCGHRYGTGCGCGCCLVKTQDAAPPDTAQPEDTPEPLTHMEKSASATVCGLPTYEPPIHLGVLTVDPVKVTCPACMPKKYWQDKTGAPAAQPEDIPVPSPCRWCGTTEGNLITFVSTDDASEARFCKDVDACYTRKPSPGGRTCPDCGAVGLPVRDAGSYCYNRVRCAERQVEKASAR